MKVKEALAQGYMISEFKLQRGYVSRKADIEEQEVLTAQGRRKGQFYFLQPSYVSTRYCYRTYLKKP